jgi:hypothetical protein
MCVQLAFQLFLVKVGFSKLQLKPLAALLQPSHAEQTYQ